MVRKLKIPYGFQDYLPNECYAKRQLENMLSEIYVGYGYKEVETPTVEYYDVFHDVCDTDKLKKMFKLTDNDGSLLVLRPDITLQICRLASKLDLTYPQRLYYVENCFEYLDNNDTARAREFAQIGVELIGDSGLDGEIEIVTLAIKSFLRAGLTDFKIELGNNNFFKGIVSEYGLSEREISYLTSLIERKDSLALESFLQSTNASSDFYDKLLLLPTLFGGSEVFEKAEKISENKLTYSAYENLKKLYNALKEIGYEKYICIDFGMLHGYDYYSGFVFKGYSKNFGLCILDGGRYDGLCPSFGFQGKAVGFAIGVQRLLSVLNEKELMNTAPYCDYAYYCENADIAKEISFVEQLRKNGKKVIKLFCNDTETLLGFCKRNNISQAFVIRGDNITKFEKESILCQK